MRANVLKEKIAKGVMYVAIAIVFAIIVLILSSIFIKGFKCITWEMVTSFPCGDFYTGGKGGFLNAIAGSLCIVSVATIIGLFISIPILLYLNVYLAKGSKFALAVRLSLDILFGIPSIVYGAFAFIIMIYIGMRASLAGGILLTILLIVPVLVRSMDEFAKSFPQELLEVSYSLGATKLQTIGLIIRQIAPGIAAATLLAIGRAIGDAAGVMFTAGFSDSLPTSLTRPVATLPLAIFFQLSAPQEAVQERAYAAALVLTVIVLIISLLGRFITNRFGRNRL